MQNFYRKKYLIIIVFVFIVGFLFSPLTVKASTNLYFDSTKIDIYEGDTFLVDLKISTPDKSINVIDGTLLFDNSKLEIKEISTGGSLLSLWQKKPIFSNENGNLSFVGGVPDGFQGEEGEVIKIIFLAKKEGKAEINFLDGFSIFLNDGQGTQINPWLKLSSINILKRPLEVPVKDEWQILIKEDKTPPQFIETNKNNDPSLFNNNYFVSFFATDEGSGISHYEVKEGDLDFIKAESPYLLQNQSPKIIIQIKVVDKAGNENIAIIEPTMPLSISSPVYLIFVLISVIILVFIFRLRKIKLVNNIKNEK